MRKFALFSCFFSLFSFGFFAQVTDSAKKVSVSAYIESYYNYAPGAPKGSGSVPFFYNFSRYNEVSVNLAYVRCAYTDSNYRGVLNMMTGTYSEFNLAAEPGILKNIYEATAGFRIYKNLWVDAGVFPSHIGAETAIGKDNLTLSRSLIAENSPYYETGVKFSLDNGKKWAFSLLFLNGWQIMRETNGDKSLGTFVAFKPSSKLTINSCSYAGNEKADTARQYRIFHDLNFNFSPSDKLSIIGAFDVGTEQKAKADTTAGDWNLWHGAILKVRYALSKKVSMSVRLEEYWDKYGVIIPAVSQNGFQTSGFSVNLDVKPYKNVMWRTEYRYLNSKDDLFLKTDNLPTHINQNVITSLLISF